MQYYNPNPKESVFLISDNKGTQPKYKDKMYWYKINMLGNEGLAEELSSLVLSYAVTDTQNPIYFVKYEQTKIGNQIGCKSANFLYEGEQYISLQNIYKNLTHDELSEKIFSISDETNRFAYLIDYFKKNINLDLTNYIKTCITLDFIICNPDRHYGNLGVIKRSDGTFKEAPIFDNGQGLGQNYQITDPLMTNEERTEKLTAATLCGSFSKALQICNGPIFKLDYINLLSALNDYPNSIAKNFLIYNLKKIEPILNKDYISNQINNYDDYENL